MNFERIFFRVFLLLILCSCGGCFVDGSHEFTDDLWESASPTVVLTGEFAPVVDKAGHVDAKIVRYGKFFARIDVVPARVVQLKGPAATQPGSVEHYPGMADALTAPELSIYSPMLRAGETLAVPLADGWGGSRYLSRKDGANVELLPLVDPADRETVEASRSGIPPESV